MNFSPVSSMWRPSPPILIRDSVSGTWEIQTIVFKKPSGKVGNSIRKARDSQSSSATESEVLNAFHPQAAGSGQRTPNVPGCAHGISRTHQQQNAAGAAGVDERGEL